MTLTGPTLKVKCAMGLKQPMVPIQARGPQPALPPPSRSESAQALGNMRRSWSDADPEGPQRRVAFRHMQRRSLSLARAWVVAPGLTLGLTY